MLEGGSAMRKVEISNNKKMVVSTMLPPTPTNSSKELINIFAVEKPNYIKKHLEKKTKNKLRELISFFDKSSLKKAMDVYNEKELIKRINIALRAKGIKVKLRRMHVNLIKEILEKEE